MSKRVGSVGAGVTPFKGTWREKIYYELAQMATREAVKEAKYAAIARLWLLYLDTMAKPPAAG